MLKLWCVVVLVSTILCAQQAPPPPRSEGILVTGAALPVPLAEADRDVRVLPLSPRERPLYNSWFDLLRLDSSLDLKERGSGFLGDLSVRGGAFGQTLVLLNGIRVNDVQTGHFNLDLPIPLETISQIEVLKGAGSTLYGSDAVGGVVNVRTEPLQPGELRLLAGAGNFGFNQEHAVASLGRGRFDESLAFARDFSTGFTTDRDYRNLAFSSLSTVRSSLGTTSLLLAYSDRPFGANNFYGALKPQYERIKSWFVSGQQDLGEDSTVSFAFRRHTDLYVYLRYNPSVYTNRHADESYQGTLRRRNRLKQYGTLSYGVEGFADNIESNNLGGHNRVRGSGYLFYDLRSVKRYSLSAGIREEVYGAHQVANSPSLSGAAWLSSRIKLRAAATRGFRLPTYTELYYSSPTTIGNANLKPETATSYEAGLDAYFRPKLHIAVTVFQRRDSNGIDYVRAEIQDPFHATNFDALHFTGVDALAAYETQGGQNFSVSFSALRGRSKSPQILMSEYTFNQPVHSGVLEWRGRVGKNVIARTRIGVVNRIARDPYGLWDASAGYGTGRIRPFVQFTNISNTVYQDTLFLAEPTRQIIGGVEVYVFGAKH